MGKKLFSLLLIMTIITGCFSVGFSPIVPQARDAGVGTGAESFNPVKFYPTSEVLIGTNVNTELNVEIIDKNYKIKINSITAYIPFYVNGGISYLNVDYTKDMVITGAKALNVTGTLKEDVNSVVRYTIEYDILDKKDITVWKNLTGYAYSFVSSKEAVTGPVGNYHSLPGDLSDGCFFTSLDTLNTTYVQQSELALLYNLRTQSAGHYHKERTRGVNVISGNAPTTLVTMPDNQNAPRVGQMNWPKCDVIKREDSGCWLRMTEPESGYYNFTISFNSWNDDWEDQSNITETTEMYYIRNADRVDALSTVNKFVKTSNTFADGYYVQKGRYTEETWNKFVEAMDMAYQVALSVPNANHGYKIACINAQSANEVLDAAFADLKEAEHDFYTYKDAVIVPATCTEDGSEFVTCICGETKTIIYPATGHTRGVWTVLQEATCTNTGKEEVRCTTCNEIVEEKVTPKIAHTFETTTVLPNCTEQGYDMNVCTTCGYSYSANYVAATGHTYNYLVIKPTCTEQGYTISSCKKCIYKTTGNYVPANGHIYKSEVVKPTCTEQGYTKYVCSYCDDSYTADIVEALGHKPLDEAVIENVVDPTCTKEGSFDTVVYCEVCDGEVSRETTIVPTVEHTMGEAVEENRVDPTNTESGSYDLVVYCTVCGGELNRETVVIPMLGGYFNEEDGATTVIDKEHMYIYGLDVALDDIEEYVEYSENVTVKLDGCVGTGTTVQTYRGAEEWETYTIIIFGDLNGDGVIDVVDTSFLAAIVNGDVELEEDSPILFAADLDNDSAVDICDLMILYAEVNGETEISQKPEKTV